MNGWLVFAVVAAITFCSGLILAIAVLRATWAQREREALTSNDLRALEESALILIEQLKAEVDSGIQALESRSSGLQDLLKEVDDRISSLWELETQPKPRAKNKMNRQAPQRSQILAMAARGSDCAEIAREAGVGCAEVKLMLRLAELDD